MLSKQKLDQETEWAITIMLDRRFTVERNLQKSVVEGRLTWQISHADSSPLYYH